MSMGWRARKIAATRAAVSLGSGTGMDASSATILMPAACPRHPGPLYGADGRSGSASPRLYRGARELGGGDHVHHRLWRIVRVSEPAVSRDDAAHRRRDIAAERNPALRPSVDWRGSRGDAR